MEQALGYPHPTSPETDDMVIGIVDADMILLQPIVNDFSSWKPSSLWNAVRYNLGSNRRHRRQSSSSSSASPPLSVPRTRVEHGHPMAQEYFLDLWRKKTGVNNLTSIIAADSPLRRNLSRYDAKYSYGAGPPYLLTARDLYAVVTVWCELVPKVYRVYPELLAEMFAYSMAAAHLQLKHQLANGFMLSTVTEEREAWRDSIDSLSLDEACQPLSLNRRHHGGREIPFQPPLVLHFCQEYSIGEFWFDKGFIHSEIISCDAPLLVEPPLDSGTRYEYYLTENQEEISFLQDTSILNHSNSSESLAMHLLRVRQTFATCTLFRSLNAAAIHYKDQYCGTTANYNKTMKP